MIDSDLRLFVDSQLISPYAMSVYVALCEKNISFKITPINLQINENEKGEFAEKSYTRRVPALYHNGFSLSESSAITEYIDESFPGVSLYPKDLQQKARVRQIQAWLRSDLMPIRLERPTEVIFHKIKKPPLSVEARISASKLFTVADLLISKSSNNLCDQWSIADADLALMLNRLILHGDSVPEKLVVYASHQWQRPTIQQWVAQKRPLTKE